MQSTAKSLAEFFLSGKKNEKQWFKVSLIPDGYFFVERIDDRFVVGDFYTTPEYLGEVPDDERQADFLATLALTIAEESINECTNVPN